jgi:E2/UBC family protein E/multiubiquitin
MEVPGQQGSEVVIEVIEIVELEEHAKRHGTHAPHAKHYAFRVDKTRVVVDMPTITGREILAKVGKTPEQYKLYQHKRGHQPILIQPDQVVDLREPGVERFTTMPKDTTEGLQAPCLRLDFRMPAADEEYLYGLGLAWETIRDGQSQWLLIHGWKVPTCYNASSVDLALLIPPNYSDSQIDMVYFKPALARSDGKPINNLSHITIANQTWQQWSRHRTQQNPWRAGIDDVASHLGLVDEWLRREFGLR